MDIQGHFPCDSGEEKNLLFSCGDINMIYKNIADDKSKDIFINRLLYSQTSDYKYISNIVLGTKAGRNLYDELDGPLYIYGAGRRGKQLIEGYPNKDWQGFIDEHKRGEYMGYPIICYKEFIYNPRSKVILSNKYEYETILHKLVQDKGIDRSKIIVLEDYAQLVSQDIYFDPQYLLGRDWVFHGDIFLDIGCFDGKDTLKAIDFFVDKEIDIYAIEPDSKNYEVCCRRLCSYNNVSIYNKGVSSTVEMGRFSGGGKAGAKFTCDGDELVELDTIDNIVGDNKVGYIKMDIEGYEEEALIGAAKTIKKWKPVLAVSVYHKKSDIWKLPLRILELNKDYRFYMGHYTLAWGDTVLYAIDKSRL